MAKRPLRTNIPRKKLQATQKAGILKRRPQMQDARLKITQKKRLVVKDARDILTKLSKGQDARTRLNRLRQKRISPDVKIIGSNILQKTDKNGKISLITNKNKQTINAVVQKELGLVTAPKKPVVRRPVLRQPVEEAVRVYDPAMYRWAKPALRTAASQMIGSLEARAWPKAMRLAPTYVDLDAVDDEEMPLVPLKQTITLQGSTRISNIHSRLDTAPIEQETHGIFGQPKTKVVVPAGHRIVVSNLQPTVTEDDVKELFEDIGQLLTARLVRPGVAEVIYKNLKDAQKAVDTYHNRQLDGQPMKCLLVNKRPLNNPTAPPLTKMETQGLINTVEVAPTATNKLVPDLSTIHKVLFQRK